jgi:hypothetical protein
MKHLKNFVDGQERGGSDLICSVGQGEGRLDGLEPLHVLE